MKTRRPGALDLLTLMLAAGAGCSVNDVNVQMASGSDAATGQPGNGGGAAIGGGGAGGAGGIAGGANGGAGGIAGGGNGGAGGIAGRSGSSGGAATGGSGGASGSTSFGGQGGRGGFFVPDGAPRDDGARPPPGTDAACAADTRDGVPFKKDLIVLFDTSASMSCDAADPTCTSAPPGTPNSRLGAVRTAINDFVGAPASADVRVGLGVYPAVGGDQCMADYSQLAIPIAPAKDNAWTFTTVLGGLVPHMNTPTEQALTGAYKAAKDYVGANPGRSVAVVLVTDGIPYACGNDQTGAVSAGLAKAAFNGSPPIETYVGGMGNVATLDAVALAGTGGVTHYIDANVNASTKILDLLKAVSTMITCDYTIPTAGKTPDYAMVNVQARVGATGPMQRIYNVPNAASCGAKGGWYYDVNLPATPTKITLCPQSCDPLNATGSSALQVLFGCSTTPAPL
jgi:hypothetical protein